MIRLFLLVMFFASCAYALEMPRIDVTVEVEPYPDPAPAFNDSLFANNLEWVQGGNGLLDENGGWNEELLRAAQELHPPLVRFPGGQLASRYNWENGIGAVEERGTGLDFAGTGQPMRFGTDEYLELLDRLQARGMMTVNLGKDPAETAAWLRYISRQTGGRAPQAVVPLWEIGNESYLKMDPSFVAADDYVTLYEAHYKQLKAVDPTIKVGALLIANTLGLPWVKPIIPENETWNDTVIAGLRKKGVPADFYSIHLYALFDSDPDDNKNRQALLVAPAILENKIRLLRETLAKHGDTTPLHVTEFSIVMKEPMSTWKYSLDPVQGTYIMDMIMMFARNGIEAAYFWNMLNSYNFGAYGNDSDYLYATGRLGGAGPGYRPAGRVFLNLRQYRGMEMLRAEIKAPTVTFAPVGIVTGNESASIVNAIGLRSANDMDGPVILAVNRSLKDTLSLTGMFRGKKLVPVDATRVCGDEKKHPLPFLDKENGAVVVPPMSGVAIAYEAISLE